MTIRLSVLDQSPISAGSNAYEALRYTIRLAQLTDELGFTRFLVSEHHDAKTLAGSSPEVLISSIAAQTEHIRVGSGGVMLPHYASYKVAENFKVLEALYPNRIDVGIGRAPGGMPRATYALNQGSYRNVDDFPEKIDELSMYLNDTLPKDHRYGNLKATPLVEEGPPILLLGSSPHSAQLAAEKKLPYIFAHFINEEAGQLAMKTYHRMYEQLHGERSQQTAVAVFFNCAETEEEAEALASSLDLSLLKLAQGMPMDGTPPPEEAMNYPYTQYDLQAIRENRKRMVVGTPAQVKEQIERLATMYETEEVILVMSAYDYEAKLKAYELIAKEML